MTVDIVIRPQIKLMSIEDNIIPSWFFSISCFNTARNTADSLFASG